MNMVEKLGTEYSTRPKGDGGVEALEGRLAEETVGLFRPVRPSPAFRQRLHDDLLAMMRRGPALQVAAPPARRRWALIAGATVGSLVSICGVVAYLVRLRLLDKPQHAVS